MGCFTCWCGEHINEDTYEDCIVGMKKLDYESNLNKTIGDCEQFRYIIYKCEHCGGLLIWDNKTETLSYFKPAYSD